MKAKPSHPTRDRLPERGHLLVQSVAVVGQSVAIVVQHHRAERCSSGAGCFVQVFFSLAQPHLRELTWQFDGCMFLCVVTLPPAQADWSIARPPMGPFRSGAEAQVITSAPVGTYSFFFRLVPCVE